MAAAALSRQEDERRLGGDRLQTATLEASSRPASLRTSPQPDASPGSALLPFLPPPPPLAPPAGGEALTDAELRQVHLRQLESSVMRETSSRLTVADDAILRVQAGSSSAMAARAGGQHAPRASFPMVRITIGALRMVRCLDVSTAESRLYRLRILQLKAHFAA